MEDLLALFKSGRCVWEAVKGKGERGMGKGERGMGNGERARGGGVGGAVEERGKEEGCVGKMSSMDRR